MNIREHIEAGHYPRDDKGRALVPMDCGCIATVYATDYSEPFPIVAVSGAGKWTHHFDGDGKLVYPTDVAGYRLLPPPPRKVKVTAWATLARGMPGHPEKYIVHLSKTEKEAARWGCSTQERIQLTGEYDEPWS